MKSNLSGWGGDWLFVQSGSPALICKNILKDRTFKTSYYDWLNNAICTKPITFPTFVCCYMSKIHFWPESLEDRLLQDDNADEREGTWFQVHDSWGHAIQHGFTSFDRAHTSHTWWNIKIMVNNGAIYIAVTGCDLYFASIHYDALKCHYLKCVRFLSVYQCSDLSF